MHIEPIISSICDVNIILRLTLIRDVQHNGEEKTD
jgi:hypothetical protein